MDYWGFCKEQFFCCNIDCNGHERINGKYLFQQLDYRGINPLYLEEEYAGKGRDRLGNSAVGSLRGKGLVSVMNSRATSTLDNETKEGVSTSLRWPKQKKID